MKHVITILFLLITTISYSQINWTLATSAGVNYVMEGKTLSDAKTSDLRETFIQVSYQMYLSEQLHQLEPYVRIQRGDYEGVKFGIKGHLNAIPILNANAYHNGNKWNIRTLIGTGLAYDTWNESIDFPLECKLSIKMHRALFEAGASVFLLESQFYGTTPELFFSIGWIF